MPIPPPPFILVDKLPVFSMVARGRSSKQGFRQGERTDVDDVKMEFDRHE